MFKDSKKPKMLCSICDLIGFCILNSTAVHSYPMAFDI